MSQILLLRLNTEVAELARFVCDREALAKPKFLLLPTNPEKELLNLSRFLLNEKTQMDVVNFFDKWVSKIHNGLDKT